MSDLIRREDVDKAIQSICDICGELNRNNGVMCGACNLDSFVRVLDDIPSAEPERKKGEWKEKQVLDDADYGIPQWQSAKCSVCGKYLTTPYLYNFDNYNFCPHCGADMRGDVPLGNSEKNERLRLAK